MYLGLKRQEIVLVLEEDDGAGRKAPHKSLILLRFAGIFETVAIENLNIYGLGAYTIQFKFDIPLAQIEHTAV
jgi:hypothetical protein